MEWSVRVYFQSYILTQDTEKGCKCHLHPAVVFFLNKLVVHSEILASDFI